MPLSKNVIANADDFGMNSSINKAIAYSFEKGYINSTSLMVNMSSFEEAVDMISGNSFIKNIGLHVNIAEGKPVSNFKLKEYLDEAGNWNVRKVNRKFNFLNSSARQEFLKEIHSQIDKALANNVSLTHLDSHLHTHTLPGFYKLFLQAARAHHLKIRIAQTYSEGSYLKSLYRNYINKYFSKESGNYSDIFENVERYLKKGMSNDEGKIVELMFHPFFDKDGNLSDHYDAVDFAKWIDYVEAN